MENELKKYFMENSKKFNIELSEIQIEKFYKYMELLLEWNEKINLTAITDKKEIILKHFIDSLTILQNIGNGESLMDLGTGAGFPGIPIAIMKEDINITLVDSLNKRINFLNEVIKCLELKNVTTIHSRAEEIGKDKKYREKYDIVVSRAVANLTTLSEYLLPLVKVNGFAIAMKGPNIDQELVDSKFAMNILGGKIEKIYELYLDDVEMKRNIICIKKVRLTPNRFPRKAGLPSKEPLVK